VNKTAASAAQFAKSILLHAYSRTTAAPAVRAQTKTSFYWQAGITLFLVIN